MKKNQHHRRTEGGLLMQTLYDLRLPLASMKERLEELAAWEDLSEAVRREICTVLQQTGVLYRLAEGCGRHLRKEQEPIEVQNARLKRIRAYARLYAKPSKGEADDSFRTCTHCNNEQDWRFISLVKKHVENNMTDPAFNVDSLCDLLNMSRSSFYNKLKALTGQAPADYVRLIRLSRAQTLLKEHRYSITEVADMTGFNDAKYFREVFKKHFGVSPSQYAKDNPLKSAEENECIS